MPVLATTTYPSEACSCPNPADILAAIVGGHFFPSVWNQHRELYGALAGILRHLRHHGGRVSRGVAAEMYGITQKMTHLRPAEDEEPNDPDLVQCGETELFRDPHIPKGPFNVNAEGATIVLRGQVERPRMMRAVERNVRKVHWVRAVENLLHLRGTPAPNEMAALRTRGPGDAPRRVAETTATASRCWR